MAAAAVPAAAPATAVAQPTATTAADPAAAAADAAGPVVVAPVGTAAVFLFPTAPVSKAHLLAIEVYAVCSSRIEAAQLALVVRLCCDDSLRETAAFLATYLKFRRSMPAPMIDMIMERTMGSNLLQTVAARLFSLPNSMRGPHDRWFFNQFWPRFSDNPAVGPRLWEAMKRRDIVSWFVLSDEDRARPVPDLMPVKQALLAFMAEIPDGSEPVDGEGGVGPLRVDMQSGADWYYMLGFHACQDRAHRAELFDAYAALARQLVREPARGQQQQQHPQGKEGAVFTFRDLWVAVLRGGVVELLGNAGHASRVLHFPPRFYQFMAMSHLAPKASVWRLMQAVIWVEAVTPDLCAREAHDVGPPVLESDEGWGFAWCAPSLRNKLVKFYRRLIGMFENPLEIERGRQSGNFLKWCEENNNGEIRVDIKLILADVLPTRSA
ncbi:hypothetical protein GGTG_14130 [Gaeumannomyces tritici R3-111a-1]|uniref:Uncharacterized protein n=1 Tax=Gaeumannomyces tritici (strain R3-111a-1) TaxID=644352 RepID=J3PKR5_GAET3|nr:hypothetical protein GGTG_14130 [Gaeumannomyces tritici R3-111a-1]EJT68291.1 hypothetical protein GGTG_14130 [Gaeumannomyces tritici R3-111a-1]